MQSLEFESFAQFEPQSSPRAAGSVSQQLAPRATPSPTIQLVDERGKPLASQRFEIHQKGQARSGSLDFNGALQLASPALRGIDWSQEFRLHVDGYVCCIVSGARLLANAEGVEYGGQTVDWDEAEHSDLARRRAFWREYDKARTMRRVLPLQDFALSHQVQGFWQHDHVMRRPIKLLSSSPGAVFEARPVAIRLGPLLRYADTRRALVWLELETPGLVRVVYGKSTSKVSNPFGEDSAPSQRKTRYGTSVRVGGRHYALIWLEELEADTVYQYALETAPLPPSGPLPVKQGDYLPSMFSEQPATREAMRLRSFSGSPWLFFRTLPREGALRFAHGSCRKWPFDSDGKPKAPSPDMLEKFGAEYLAKKGWAEWPQFFLHTGDQIYADDVGNALGAALVRARFASRRPGPIGQGDLREGAWAGRFGARYAPLKAQLPFQSEWRQLKKLKARATHDSQHDIGHALSGAERAEKQAGRINNPDPLAEDQRRTGMDRKMPFRFRVLNGLLWHLPYRPGEVPIVDKARGLIARQSYQLPRETKVYRVGYPSAGETSGVHAADYAEYSELYAEAWETPHARKALAHVPSFMIFDDHDVTDDWNADKNWIDIVHSKDDPLKLWPTTITDALCAYWIYQGWGNLAPEAWRTDPRVAILERCKAKGTDALPELRTLIDARAVAPRAQGLNAPDPARKLAWHFEIPTPGMPFLAVDLRTDRDTVAAKGMSRARLEWIEQRLNQSNSPVAFLVLPVPWLMPDPMLFIFRHPTLAATLAGKPSEVALVRDADLEHPAGNEVWNQLRELVVRLGKTKKLKTLVIVSGDIHFSCNLDGKVDGAPDAPRVLQLVGSGLQQRVDDFKRSLLVKAYGNIHNVLSRAQGVDRHRGMTITLGGMQTPDAATRRENFLFETSVATVSARLVPHGNQRLPEINQTHWIVNARGKFEGLQFFHLAQPDGRALMTLKNPGFTNPNGPDDYPTFGKSGHGMIREAQEFFEEESSLDPGQSIRVDGQSIGTYRDASAWYAARQAALVTQKTALAKENLAPPKALARLVAEAGQRRSTMAVQAAKPVSDRDMEMLLDWGDEYIAALAECDETIERLTADRLRAARARVTQLSDSARKLEPQLRERQRSAFLSGKTSRLKDVAEALKTALDTALTADQWLLEAASSMEDIRVLGTTLRAQKALHGSPLPWNDLLRRVDSDKVAKLTSVGERLNKLGEVAQLLDKGLAVISGTTASRQAVAGLSFANQLASAGGSLLGASGFFSLYVNFYLSPALDSIAQQLGVIQDLVSQQNRSWIQFGKLDYVNWSVEPGGREMYEFMHAVKLAGRWEDVGRAPAGVRKYFSKHRARFEAGITNDRGVKMDASDPRQWAFFLRNDIWGMLYGSLSP